MLLAAQSKHYINGYVKLHWFIIYNMDIKSLFSNRHIFVPRTIWECMAWQHGELMCHSELHARGKNQLNFRNASESFGSIVFLFFSTDSKLIFRLHIQQYGWDGCTDSVLCFWWIFIFKASNLLKCPALFLFWNQMFWGNGSLEINALPRVTVEITTLNNIQLHVFFYSNLNSNPHTQWGKRKGSMNT